MTDGGRAVTGLGLLICTFALGVLFASNGAAVFAAVVASTVGEAAIGWFVLGLFMQAVGLNNVRKA
jgi:hypothetical protein